MRVYSIFASINGEVTGVHQGRLTVFVRLAGCNLRCRYCDTKYAWSFDSGAEMSLEEIVENVTRFGIKNVTITGGEPMLQWKQVTELTRILSGLGISVSVETNGSLPLRACGVRSWVVDYKLPSSGEYSKMNEEAFRHLGSADVVKFVVGDRDDFEVAMRVRRGLLSTYYVGREAPLFAFSPVFGTDPAELVQWMLDSELEDGILSLQIHKYIWPGCGKGEER